MVLPNNYTHHLSPHQKKLSFLTKIFISILLVVIFEGAIRKWVSNSLTIPLIFTRDALALIGIIWGIINGYNIYYINGFNILLTFTIVLVFWGIIQFFTFEGDPPLYLLGLRFWLLYMWFSFFAIVKMTHYEFLFISRISIALLIAMVPLVIIQHYSPPNSFINRQAVEGTFIFRVYNDIVRTTGTFSFTSGYTTFLPFVSPFVFSFLEKSASTWKSRFFNCISITALLIATIVSGSRTAVIFFAIIFFSYTVLSVLFHKGKHAIRSLLNIAFVLLAIIIFMSIFSRAVEATYERFSDAYRHEDPLGRLEYNYGIFQEFSLLGHGIGSGNNVVMVSDMDREKFVTESESGRVFFELGALGIVAILIKLCVIVVNTYKSFLIARKTGNVNPLLFWITISYALMSLPVIGQLTVNALVYFLLGLGLVSVRLNRGKF